MLSGRRLMKFKIAFVFLAAVTVPATAQITFDDSPAAKPAAKPASKSDLDKMVCRVEQTVGSRLGAKKTCMTAREWKDLEDETRQAVEKFQQGQGVTPSG